jgi:sugar transferase EpsL
VNVGRKRDGGKRSFDVLVSVSVLILLSPVLVLSTIVVAVGIGRPVFFTQSRPGRAGNLFTLYKFRTMKPSQEKDGRELPDQDRLTVLGRWMRKWSLDELPELYNVLMGDMSLVGPRPLLVQYLDRYTPEQARRHEVKPGITGWAQINGRNAITWEEKFALDVWYVDNRSFWLDMKILVKTAWKVLKREGISAEGEATMPEFKGTIPNRGESRNA